MPPDELGLRGVDAALMQDRPRPNAPGPVSAPTQIESPHALKILLLEDDPNDAELMQRELRTAGLDFIAKRVDTRADFVVALETFAPDLVLADYKLPDFNGAEALAHVRQVHPEIPVVMVTGTLGEEAAVELLKAGAKDYVLKSSLLRLPSAVERAISIEEGIRARKAAEAAVRESEEKFRAFTAAAPTGIVVIDASSTISYWNPAAERIFGYTAEEAVGRKIHQWLVPARFQAAAEAGFRAFSKTGQGPVIGRTIEVAGRRKDGVEIPIELSLNALRVGAEWHAVGILHDISERKHAEAALSASHTLLETAERIAHIGGFEWDIASGQVVWSEELYRIFGQSPGQFVPTRANFINCVHPDDRGPVQEAIDASVTRNAPYDIEFRIVRPDQTERIIQTRGELARDAAGKPIRMTGTSQDITERKRAEETIREDDAKFRSLVEQNVAGIFIVREDGTIGYVNPFFASLLGYAAAELIGHPLLDFIPEESRAYAGEKLGAELAGGLGFLQETSAMQRGDGGRIDVLLNASRSIFEGRPASLAVVLDVTERNKAQRELASTAAILTTEHEVSPDGIVAVDAQRSIISFNRRFVEMWGFPTEIIASKSEEQTFGWALQNRIADPAAIAPQMEEALAHPEERGHHEAALTDGRVFEIHRSPMTRPDGGSMGRVWFFRDITEHKAAERTLRRLNRTLRTLSRGNEALVRAATEPDLLNDMCQAIVENGGYRMAWVGVPQQDAAKTVTPVAWAGIGAEFFDGPPLHSWAGESEGGCVCGLALNSGQSQTSQDLMKDSAMTLWRARFARHGISAAASFPLNNGTDGFTVLTIYAAEADAFDSDELKLLQELAADLAFGIRSLREHTAREALDKRWRASLEATIGAIASTVEMRDPYTAGHQQRVASLAVAMARELHLPEEQIDGLYLAGIVHDVGKIDIPAEILNKPGKLSKLQYQLIQAHAQAGYDIVKGVDFPWPIADMVRQHHERLDGSGYPQGLKAEAILPEAKILAVADVVEAMMSHRPYRASLGIAAALAEIEEGKGRLYDLAAVAACTALFRHNGFSFE